MKNPSYPSLLEIAVLAYCAWESSTLPNDWISTPALHWGWLALIIWCVPVLYHQVESIRFNRPKGSNIYFLVAAIVFTLLGSIGAIKALIYVGLAFALAGMMPWYWPMLIWLPCAIGWMPALGWASRHYALGTIHLMEVSIALVGTAVLMTWQLRRVSA